MRGAGLHLALLACRTKPTSTTNERTPTTALTSQRGMEMKIEQTTTTSWRWGKESQQAYIFAYLFISCPEGRTVAAAIVVDG